MYWIKPRRKWGDYGNVLFHGEDYVAKEGHSAPPGTTVAWLCDPHEPVLLPAGSFICTGEVLDSLVKIIPNLDFGEVWVERLIKLPIKRWLDSGQPRYPASGEPEDYFSEHDDKNGFRAGFGNNLYRVLPDAQVAIEADPRFDPQNPQPVPRLRHTCLEPYDLILGKRQPVSTIGPLFCSTRFAEILDSLNCVNFELVRIT